MNKLFAASAVLIALTGAAGAADLDGSKMRSDTAYSDVSAPVGSWTGVYFGAHAGYGWNSHDLKMTEREVTPGRDAYCTEGNLNANGTSCTVVTAPASCSGENKLGYVADSGKCYPITKAERCGITVDGRLRRQVLVGHQCYSVNDVAFDPVTHTAVVRNDAKPENAAFPAVVSDVPDTDAEHTDAVISENKDAYVAAVDAKTTITNTLLAIDPDGIFGGIHAGADYQVSGGRLVFGVFGDVNFADSEKSDDFGIKINDGNSYLIAGRVGALVNDKTLLYALVGYGWQDVTYSGDSKSIDKTFGHVVAGGGLEYKFTKELSLSFEGQHWFESDEKIESTVDADGSSFELTDSRSDTRVLARVNYRFGN